MSYKIGDVVHYITLFNKIKPCIIIDKRTIRTEFYCGIFETRTEFIIEFMNGKKKIVKEEKIF